MKKIFGLMLAMIMVIAMAIPAMAASITINQDDSYAGTEDEAGREYKYYKVFSAVPAEDFSQNFVGGYDTDGNAVTAQGNGKVAYTATAAVGALLADNQWFDATLIESTGEYSVQWKEGVEPTAENVQAAAAWLIENNAFESGPTTMDFADGKWTATGLEDGYYVIVSDTGKNLVAVTGDDITINEKNDYPPVVKEEEDEDSIKLVDEDTGEALNVAIGDSIAYTVTVTIPAAAKAGETIEVWDKPSDGLTYNDDLLVSPAGDVTDGTVGEGEIWHKIITVTAANRGTEIVFSYSMTINDDALVDLDRMNEATLKYGNNYESLPHSVYYTTYFGGIIKIDGDTEEPLEGVKFDLFEDGEAFNVIKSGDYYIPAGEDVDGATNEVVTDADGLIVIRGLDFDKTYTLTETETLPSYNMLTEDVTLTLEEDVDGAYDAMEPTEYQPVENNQGTVLPSTGGIGTTVFYIIGAVLVIGAGVVLVTRRRMNTK